MKRLKEPSAVWKLWRPLLVGCVAVATGAASATSGCGGTVTEIPGTGSDTDSGTDAEDPDADAPEGDSGVPLPDANVDDAGAGGGAPDEPYDDPGCPEPDPVEDLHQCEPFSNPSGCAQGQRCVPFVIYADNCQTEQFGTACTLAGDGVQGDSCDTSACADGFVCVVTNHGTQCAELCPLDTVTDTCPGGLVCSVLDVDGYGVCS